LEQHGEFWEHLLGQQLRQLCGAVGICSTIPLGFPVLVQEVDEDVGEAAQRQKLRLLSSVFLDHPSNSG